MFGIFEILNINSWHILTMRSGGGVLLMKHLIWPFSPCKACCVCVLEIVGGPERKVSHRVIFKTSCDIDLTFASRSYLDCSGFKQEHLYWVTWATCWRRRVSITQHKHLKCVTGGRKRKPQDSSCIKELLSYGWLTFFPRGKYWCSAVGRVQD